MNKNTTGFTIIELLIVIVVIAILAALSIVTYTNIQQRARDTQRKNDLAQIAKALHLYNVEYDTFNVANTGSGGGGNGWFNHDYDGVAGPLRSMAAALVAENVMSGELIDPSGATGVGCGTPANPAPCRAYMKATCLSNGVYVTWLYASLESEPAGQDGPLNGTCQSTWDTAYGMNYALRVN